MELIKAIKGEKTTYFSIKVWESGLPQRYGWREAVELVARKTLPMEILDFAKVTKKKVEPAPEPEPEAEAEEVIEPKPKKPRKKKKNDNPE